MKTLVLSLCLLSLLCASCALKETKEFPPNIIFILADDLGFGDVQAFNPESKILTPHLNQLAAEGMKFTDAHTSSSVCTPTRYAFLTGRYNWRSPLKSGVLTGKSKALIEKQRTTVASLLKSRAYHTAFIGKWHLGWDWAIKDWATFNKGGWNNEDFDQIDFTKPIQNGPESLGFDYSYGHAGSLDMAPYVYVENGRITQMPDKVTIDEGEYSWWRKGPTSPDFIHEEVSPNFFRRSMDYIKERADEENPFFLYLALPSPHTPILPPKAWQGESGLLPYADFMMMIDDYIGQLNQTIKDAGIEENTLVIFMSDNGCSPAAGFDKLVEMGHLPSAMFRGHKADIFEGGHRVPFIAKWPNKIKAGTSRNETISITDFFATVSEISGYQINDDEGEDSYSLVPLFDADQKMETFREATVFHSIDGSFAIRKGDWKLITTSGSGGWSYPRPTDSISDSLPKVQLYNLAKDPGERSNLEHTAPEKVEELKQILIRYIREGRSTPGLIQQNDPYEGEWKQTWFMKGD